MALWWPVRGGCFEMFWESHVDVVAGLEWLERCRYMYRKVVFCLTGPYT